MFSFLVKRVSLFFISLSIYHGVSAIANGACVEAGVQDYQIRAINRGPAGFMYPLYVHGHPDLHHPTHPLQVVSINHPSQVAATPRMIPTNSLSNTGINPTLDVVDSGPTFLDPVSPTGFRLYRPHQREIVLDPNIRHRNLPHLRVLPEDVIFFFLSLLPYLTFLDIYIAHKSCF